MTGTEDKGVAIVNAIAALNGNALAMLTLGAIAITQLATCHTLDESILAGFFAVAGVNAAKRMTRS